MSNALRTFTPVRWTQPIRVRVGNGVAEAVKDPMEALAYLDHRWPLVDGPCRDLARDKCIRSLEYHVNPEEAREAFISAAIEAHMLA